MKLPEHYRIIITGRTISTIEGDMACRNLADQLARLLKGFEVADTAFRPFGLKLEFEEDADQGDEGPEAIAALERLTGQAYQPPTVPVEHAPVKHSEAERRAFVVHALRNPAPKPPRR